VSSGQSPDYQKRELITRLRAQGLAITEIALRLGRTRQAVYAMLKKCGADERLPLSRRWSPEEDALLGAVTDWEAAQRLGCCVSTVQRRRRQLGKPVCDVRLKNLSQLQTWILSRAGAQGFLSYGDILTGYYGWEPRSQPAVRLDGGARLICNRRHAGRQKYGRTRAIVSRARRALCGRGLVRRVVRSHSAPAGVALTSLGRTWLAGLAW